MNIDRKRTMEAASNNTWESKTATKRALPRPSPKFTVTYSRLCDGGAQEMSTAVCAIRDVFSDASISTYRRTSQEDVALGTPNPEVVITDDNSNRSVLWSSKQRNLYQKYPKKRKKSIKEIRKVLEALRASYEKGTTTAVVVPPVSKKDKGGMMATTTTKPPKVLLSPRSSSSRPASAIATAAVAAVASVTSIPLPSSLNVDPVVVNEVSEDFSTAPEAPIGANCELDENGVCRIFSNPLL